MTFPNQIKQYIFQHVLDIYFILYECAYMHKLNSCYMYTNFVLEPTSNMHTLVSIP